MSTIKSVTFQIDGSNYTITPKTNPRLYDLIKKHHEMQGKIMNLSVCLVSGRLIKVSVSASLPILYQIEDITGGLLVFDGNIINRHDTVITLDIKDGDIIDCIKI